MLRRVLVLSASLVATAAWAEGPGSRIRTTPEVPQAMAPTITATAPEVRGCERLRAEQRERWLAALRESTAGRPPSGPEATGMANGAGIGAASGSVSGSSGTAGFGGSAPH